MPLASSILTNARVLLNDQNSVLFTDAAMLPVLRIAYMELQNKCNLHGIAVDKEQSAMITVPALMTALTFTSSPALPANLLLPIELKEKISGQPNATYTAMTRSPFVPDLTQVSRLMYWSWIQEEIRFVGATQAVPIYIRYYINNTTITATSTDIPILNSDIYLAYRTAAIAANTIGGMPTKGEILQAQANEALDEFLGIGVSNRQAMPVRRRPFRSFGRRSFWNW
jgi:hypothetical protein